MPCKHSIFVIILSSLLLKTNALSSQNTFQEKSSEAKHSYITARYHYGFTIPHHKSLIFFLEDYTRGFELTYGIANFNKDNWTTHFNHPELGIGLYGSSLGNKEVYGNVYALFPYANFHIWRTPRFSASYKVGLGLGYADTSYDEKENNRDMIIGSSFNAYVSFGLLADYRIHNHFSVSGAFSLNHFSNGAARQPNYGANICSGSLGLKYHFNDRLTPVTKKIKAARSTNKEFIAVISAGRSQANIGYKELYWSWSANLNHLWYRSEKRAWGVAADIIYFGGAPIYFKDGLEAIDKSKYSAAEHMYGGVLGSYNLFIKKFTMVMQMGVYVLYKTKPDQPVYSRLGVRYNISDKWLANFSVKAGFFKSEFLEFGVGYRIKY